MWESRNHIPDSGIAINPFVISVGLCNGEKKDILIGTTANVCSHTLGSRLKKWYRSKYIRLEETRVHYWFVVGLRRFMTWMHQLFGFALRKLLCKVIFKHFYLLDWKSRHPTSLFLLLFFCEGTSSVWPDHRQIKFVQNFCYWSGNILSRVNFINKFWNDF